MRSSHRRSTGSSRYTPSDVSIGRQKKKNGSASAEPEKRAIMEENTIKSYAEQIREKIQSIPNYTLTSAKALVEESGLDLQDSDVPLFMKTLLRTPYPPSRKYAYLHFTWTIKDYLESYAAKVRVERNGMVNRIVIEQRPTIGRVKDRIEIDSSEIEIRHYDDNQDLIEGRIYPLPHEEYIKIMIHADQWIRELPPPEKFYFDEKGVLISSSNAANPPKEERKPITWTVEFCCYTDDLKSTTSSAPRSQHADEIRAIIEKLLPDVAPYIF